jgi:hypothetical protein
MKRLLGTAAVAAMMVAGCSAHQVTPQGATRRSVSTSTAPAPDAWPARDGTGRVAGTTPPLPDAADIVAGRCPPAVTGWAMPDLPPGFARPGPAVATSLVPVEARYMVLCRYNGMNTRPYRKLRAARVVTGAPDVPAWRTRFNDLPAVPARPRSCPFDDDRWLLIAFVASPRSFVVLSARLAGCGYVSDGVQLRDLASAPDWHFRDDLLRLVGG